MKVKILMRQNKNILLLQIVENQQNLQNKKLKI